MTTERNQTSLRPIWARNPEGNARWTVRGPGEPWQVDLLGGDDDLRLEAERDGAALGAGPAPLTLQPVPPGRLRVSWVRLRASRADGEIAGQWSVQVVPRAGLRVAGAALLAAVGVMALRLAPLWLDPAPTGFARAALGASGGILLLSALVGFVYLFNSGSKRSRELSVFSQPPRPEYAAALAAILLALAAWIPTRATRIVNRTGGALAMRWGDGAPRTLEAGASAHWLGEAVDAAFLTARTPGFGDRIGANLGADAPAPTYAPWRLAGPATVALDCRAPEWPAVAPYLAPGGEHRGVALREGRAFVEARPGDCQPDPEALVELDAHLVLPDDPHALERRGAARLRLRYGAAPFGASGLANGRVLVSVSPGSGLPPTEVRFEGARDGAVSEVTLRGPPDGPPQGTVVSPAPRSSSNARAPTLVAQIGSPLGVAWGRFECEPFAAAHVELWLLPVEGGPLAALEARTPDDASLSRWTPQPGAPLAAVCKPVGTSHDFGAPPLNVRADPEGHVRLHLPRALLGTVMKVRSADGQIDVGSLTCPSKLAPWMIAGPVTVDGLADRALITLRLPLPDGDGPVFDAPNRKDGLAWLCWPPDLPAPAEAEVVLSDGETTYTRPADFDPTAGTVRVRAGDTCKRDPARAFELVAIPPDWACRPDPRQTAGEDFWQQRGCPKVQWCRPAD